MRLFNNLKVSHKISVLLAVLGLVVLGVTVYATRQMRAIDDRYSALTDGPAKTKVAMARANRAMSDYK